MSKTAYTPGPWDYFVGNTNGRGLIRIETSNDAPIAGLHIASLTRGKESEANARLGAAAPEMLDALKAALSAANDLSLSGAYFPRKQVQDAIAKAEAKP